MGNPETGEDLEWVMSGGGPLIVLPAELLRYWGGIDPKADDSTSDYDRACGVGGYLGVLNVGTGSGLVLGDEPMQTAFLPSADGGTLIRWVYAENGKKVREAVCFAPVSIWSTTQHRFTVRGARMLVFDAAYPGDDHPRFQGQDVSPLLDLPIDSGEYRIETADYRPDEGTWLILHRLSRIAC
jgi:hypothetical protein